MSEIISAQESLRRVTQRLADLARYCEFGAEVIDDQARRIEDLTAEIAALKATVERVKKLPDEWDQGASGVPVTQSSKAGMMRMAGQADSLGYCARILRAALAGEDANESV